MQNQNQNQNKNTEQLAIKQLALMSDVSKLKKLRSQLLDKCLNCEDEDKLSQYIDMISKIDNLINKCHNDTDTVILGIPEYSRNNKEEFETLRGSILGNLEYEDWMLIRKTFMVKVIDRLLGVKE